MIRVTRYSTMLGAIVAIGLAVTAAAAEHQPHLVMPRADMSKKEWRQALADKRCISLSKWGDDKQQAFARKQLAEPDVKKRKNCPSRYHSGSIGMSGAELILQDKQ